MSEPRRELIPSARQHRLLVHLLTSLLVSDEARDPTRKLLHTVRTAKRLPYPAAPVEDPVSERATAPEVDFRGNCSKCGGTHYGSTSCPYPCSTKPITKESDDE